MDRSQEEFDDCYELCNNTLGQGTFAFVFEAKPRGESDSVAVKIYIKSRGHLHLVDNEIEALKSLSHSNIIKLRDYFHTQTAKYSYLVFEKIVGGELLKHIININSHGVPYNEHQIRLKCKSILSALAHCHEHKVIHRDIKPENILMISRDDDADIKLIDFGLSVKASFDKDDLNNIYVTAIY